MFNPDLTGRTPLARPLLYGAAAANPRDQRNLIAVWQTTNPTGSVIQISNLGSRYDGIYTIMDTGAVIRGRLLDIYMRSCDEATKFGRQSAEVFVLRLGWNPHATEPSLLETLWPFKDRPTPAPPVPKR